MVDFEVLEKLRKAGVKSATLKNHPQDDSVSLCSVEFFPLPAPGFEQMDLDTMLTNAEGATDRPPPADTEDGPPNLPPAMQRILNRGSVS